MYMYIHAYTYACQREHTCLLFAGMLASHAHLCMSACYMCMTMSPCT